MTITENESLRAYMVHLQQEERSPGTIAAYLRHVRAFARWLAGKPVDKIVLCDWRAHLLAQGYAPVSINAMLAALHSYFRHCGRDDLRVHYLRVQRRIFRDDSRNLRRSDYQKLLHTARVRGQRRLALVIETIGATGIRVSELSAITVEAVKQRRADIHLKGKIRTILIPDKLCRKLVAYARTQKIACGALFRTAGGKILSRYQIWAEMKALAKASGVQPSKVFPHNLRHLFAVVFYEQHHDLARLADLLGHSSIETTRIYLLAPDDVCRRQLDSMQLVE